jgi:branched-chain amino acid transport system permease protein
VADPLRDRAAEAGEVFTRHLRSRLDQLVDADLVAEHCRSPVGTHSPALAHVLAYLRQQPTPGKLALLATRPGKEWVMIRLSGRPGHPHELLVDRKFYDEDEALHAVFLQRLSDLGVEIRDS